MNQVRARLNLDPLPELLGQVDPQALFLEPGVLDDPLVVLPEEGREIPGGLGAAAHAGRRLEGEIVSPGEQLLVVEGLDRIAASVKESSGPIAPCRHRVIHRIEIPQPDTTGSVEEAEPLADSDARCPRPAPLGRDDHHAVARLLPVDRRGRRALQDLDLLDVLRVDVDDPVDLVILGLCGVRAAGGQVDLVLVGRDRRVADEHPVYDIERRRRCVDRRGAAQPNLHAAPGGARIRLDHSARDLSLNRLLERLGRRPFEFLRGHRRHRVGQIAP